MYELQDDINKIFCTFLVSLRWREHNRWCERSELVPCCKEAKTPRWRESERSGDLWKKLWQVCEWSVGYNV